MAPGELVGKVAIVSGAASGISRVILGRLTEAGARAVIADVDGARGPGVAQELTERGRDVRVVRIDVRDSAQVDAMVRFTR